MPVPPQPTIKTKAIARRIPPRFLPEPLGATNSIPSMANAGNSIHSPNVGVIRDRLSAAWAVDPVVLIVRVDGAKFPPGVSVLGENVHVVFGGKVPHVSRTALEKEPPCGEIVRP